MKEYNPPKKVTVFLLNTEAEVSVELIKYDIDGVVFYDKMIQKGKAKIFVPYSNIGNIIERLSDGN